MATKIAKQSVRGGDRTKTFGLSFSNTVLFSRRSYTATSMCGAFFSRFKKPILPSVPLQVLYKSAFGHRTRIRIAVV